MPERYETNVGRAELFLEDAADANDEQQAISYANRAIAFALLAIVERLDKIETALQDLTRGGLA